MMTLDEYNSFEIWMARRKKFIAKENRPKDYCDYWKKVLRSSEVSKQVYTAEREQFHYQQKQEQIMHALETLAANGIEAQLACFDNCHIIAKSKSGKKMSYYAGSGTITGYYGTQINGLDEYIRLLRTI